MTKDTDATPRAKYGEMWPGMSELESVQNKAEN